MNTRFFRAGVGTVIYKGEGQVAFFERATPPIGAWEFQQGGIDKDELPGETLWRELKEEVGLTEADVELVTEMPGWLSYESAEVFDGSNASDRIGQIHKWFFLKLKPDVKIDLSNATEDEVSDYKWLPFEEAAVAPGPHKRHVYEALYQYFKQNIK